MKHSVTIHAPATVANVVCGFDILGFALNAPCDELTLSISDNAGVKIINRDDFHLPTDPEKNVSGAALLALLDEAKTYKAFCWKARNLLCPAAALVPARPVQQAQWLPLIICCKNRFTKEELVRFAMFGEKVASGVKTCRQYCSLYLWRRYAYTFHSSFGYYSTACAAFACNRCSSTN